MTVRKGEMMTSVGTRRRAWEAWSEDRPGQSGQNTGGKVPGPMRHALQVLTTKHTNDTKNEESWPAEHTEYTE